MDGIKIEVTGNIARVIERPARITAGTVGLPIEFSFDNQWEGLSKTAVFKAGCTEKIVENLDVETSVPWEATANPNVWLSIGVYGVNADGSVAIPTIWANVCVICEGANPEGDVSTAPTPPVWQRLWNAIGNLLGLTTNAKGNLVEAINEVNSIAHAGCIEPDTTLTESGKAADAKATGDAIKSLTAADVGAVPTSRTVNGKALSSDISLSASDVGAAPAGFGYGGAMTSIDLTSGDYSGMTLTAALDSVLSTMVSGSGAQLLIRDPNGYQSTRCFAKLWKYSSHAVLECINHEGYAAVLRKVGGSWKEWEHINPKMTIGVEYRTTERYNGKLVYTKIVSIGKLPAANAKVSIAYSSETVTPIRVCGVDNGKTTISKSYVSSAGAWQECFVYAMGSSVYISAKYDHSSVSADVQVWYIKD